jgi:hypothetical protein
MGQLRGDGRGVVGDGGPAEAGAPTGGAPALGRCSSRRKVDAILGLRRGGALDALSGKLGVTAATLAHPGRGYR